ncbi:MAG: aminopeptidase, partial [Pseudomonadota bacterium]
MNILKRFCQFTTFFAVIIVCSGCQVPYLLKNSWHQTKLLKSRVPIKEVIRSEETSEEVRAKLRLVQKAKKFATEKLKLHSSKSYETFVQLNRPYVTWVVRAAPPYQLKPYT